MPEVPRFRKDEVSADSPPDVITGGEDRDPSLAVDQETTRGETLPGKRGVIEHIVADNQTEKPTPGHFTKYIRCVGIVSVPLPHSTPRNPELDPTTNEDNQ